MQRTLFYLALAAAALLMPTAHAQTPPGALLTLLGVPKETVMADYMRTNKYTLPQFRRVIDDFITAGGERAIAEAVFGVKPEYLEASFDEMRKRYGTIEGYFFEGLGIDGAGQDALRTLYLGRR